MTESGMGPVEAKVPIPATDCALCNRCSCGARVLRRIISPPHNARPVNIDIHPQEQQLLLYDECPKCSDHRCCVCVDATVRTGDLSMGVKIDQLEEVSSGNRKYVQCSISGQR